MGVSMGQGQEIIARKYMASATVEGQWVLLQNTHLGLSYLTEVCSLCSCQLYMCMHCMAILVTSHVVSAR